jgi:drug/metabolite transporter (DMT)-like permease
LHKRTLLATICGAVSILLWSASVPCTRIAVEGLGLFRAAAIVMTAGGGFLVILTSMRTRGIVWVQQLSRKHLLFCGPLFVGYAILLYIAVGLARSRGEAIAAGLANYLWPTTILVFSILILKHTVRRTPFVFGIIFSLTGVFFASSTNAGGVNQLAGNLWPPPPAIGFGLLAAVLWGLYSVLANKFPQRHSSGAVGIFLLVTGLGLAAGQVGNWHDLQWTWSSALAVAYMALLPNSVAYWLWDTAVRDGSVPTLGSLANLTPVLSVAIGTMALGTGLRWEIFLGAALVASGAALSHVSFRQQT